MLERADLVNLANNVSTVGTYSGNLRYGVLAHNCSWHHFTVDPQDYGAAVVVCRNESGQHRLDSPLL